MAVEVVAAFDALREAALVGLVLGGLVMPFLGVWLGLQGWCEVCGCV